MKHIKRITTSEQLITLDEMRDFLRVDAFGSPPEHPDDSIITGMISAAIKNAENFCEIAVNPGEFRCALQRFPAGDFYLLSPLITIESFRYVDTDGNTQDFFDFDFSESGEIACLDSAGWPQTRKTGIVNVTIDFTAGYSGSNIDENLIFAIKVFCGHLYENRAAVADVQNYEMPLAYQHTLQQYRRGMGV